MDGPDGTDRSQIPFTHEVVQNCPYQVSDPAGISEVHMQIVNDENPGNTGVANGPRLRCDQERAEENHEGDECVG